MTTKLKCILDVFCKLSGQELKYFPCERLLFDYHNNGFTEDDLKCVLTFMLWQNSKREPRFRNRILFHRIVGDLEEFNSRLGEARAWERNRKKPATAREQVLKSFRGVEAEPRQNMRPITEIFKSMATL